jgi:hypothetical protein
MMRRFAVAAACVAVLAAAPALAEDLTVVFKTTGTGGAGTATSWFSTERMRTTDGATDTLVEYGPGRIVSVDHKKKEWSEITLAQLEEMMKQMSAQMEAATANMPPAMKEKMQSMMGGGGAVSVAKAGVRKVAGYDCQDYSVTMGQMGGIKVCATTAVAPPTPAADFKRFASFASSAGALASSPMFKGLAEEMKKIEGFTIADSTSMKMMGRSLSTSREATEIKKGAIPAATFDLAAIAPGYKKVDSPLAKVGK